MKIEVLNNNLVLTNLKDFNLNHIFECGQSFRWDKTDDGGYIGVAYGKALKIIQNDDSVILYDTSIEDFKNIWSDYFDFTTDYSAIKKELSSDDVLNKAIEFGGGIRILRQDLWETVVSFIISASNNIPRIKKIISSLCELYGKKIEYMGNTYYSFPTAEDTLKLTLDDLSYIKAGFRDKYILSAAKAFCDGLNCKALQELTYEDAKKELMKINGIGNKVADCILLFGLSKCNSFPIDVWIKRTVEYFYFDSPQDIKTIKEFSQKKFKNLGGYAQQYLFFYARENKIGI